MTGAEHGVFAQRFDAAGMPQGGDFQVNVGTTLRELDPSVAFDGSGRFVVAFRRDLAGLGDQQVFARLYDAAGSPLTGEIAVSSVTPAVRTSPTAAMDPNGEFLVTWVDGGKFKASRAAAPAICSVPPASCP